MPSDPWIQGPWTLDLTPWIQGSVVKAGESRLPGQNCQIQGLLDYKVTGLVRKCQKVTEKCRKVTKSDFPVTFCRF